MKIGFKGLQSGCAPPFDVWGVSLNAPNMQVLLDDGITNHIVYLTYELEDPSIQTVGYEYNQPVRKEYIPKQWERAQKQWILSAVQVPSVFPVKCDTTQYRDSGHAGTWQVELCTFAERNEITAVSPPENSIDYFVWCYGTRAIYLDGVQRYVAYRLGSGEAHFGTAANAFPYATCIGNFAIIDIGTKQHLNSPAGPYQTSMLNAGSYRNSMETIVRNFYNANVTYLHQLETVFNSATLGGQPPVNSIGVGKECIIVSTYQPGANAWSVGRFLLNSTRTDSQGNTFAGINTFFTQLGDYFLIYDAPAGTPNGLPGQEGTDGDWHVVLPSCRTYIDSTAAQPDEGWVVAMHKNKKKLITSRWLSSVYRRGVGNEGQQSGLADGTLSQAEVTAAYAAYSASHKTERVILDTSDLSTIPVEYRSESWDGLQVRCYNRVYDPTTKKSTDLLLFTTGGVSRSVANMTADFEGDINHGVPAGMSFKNGGSSDYTQWGLDTSDHHGGAGCIITNWQNVMVADVCELGFTAHFMNDNTEVSFWYKHDNRGFGTKLLRPDETIELSFLTNQPIVDNTFEFLVDGKPIACDISGTAYTTSVIDNVHVPEGNSFSDPAFYSTWRKVTVTIADKGTHHLSWKTNQVYQTNGVLRTKLDDINIDGPLMTSDDLNSKSRWFYARGKIRRAKYWAWHKVDEEDKTELDTRISTVPDYITMDHEGAVLYGNPHYFCRILFDENNNDYLDPNFGVSATGSTSGPRGYVRWTATKNIQADDFICLDPDGNLYRGDISDDPRWGSFQILPTHAGYQIRGANAAKRDATIDPLDIDQYKFNKPVFSGLIQGEQFQYKVTSGGVWSQRISCWTVSSDGMQKRPHIEVIWRPTHDQPAWPGPESEWVEPRYPSTFTNSSTTSPIVGWGFTRPREMFLQKATTKKVMWSPLNYVVPRGYSDAFTRLPQCVWVREIYESARPNEEPNIQFPPLAGALWQLCQARMCPVGLRTLIYQTDPVTDVVICPDPEQPEEDPPQDNLGSIQRLNIYGTPADEFWPLTDFDAVDLGEGGCCV